MGANENAGLAGSNKMEILIFSLGTDEVFGINVFKVREVSKTPKITKTPNAPFGVEGVISLRGNIIPVISLNKFVNLSNAPSTLGTTMMVTEYSKHIQGFLVHKVNGIIRVDWNKVKAPKTNLAGDDGLITALTQMSDGKLVTILDVEQVLVKTYGDVVAPPIAPVESAQEIYILFADDSAIARKKIVEVLDGLAVKYHQASDGLEAWKKLTSMATQAQLDGVALGSRLKLILTDAEMPEMDGYVLTKNVKADQRFKGIPVLMHSSLSSDANQAMGRTVGVDAYVAKFDHAILSETLRQMLKTA
jgi:two-component system, chemotaxis family, chemotaxis protein CheV